MRLGRWSPGNLALVLFIFLGIMSPTSYLWSKAIYFGDSSSSFRHLILPRLSSSSDQTVLRYKLNPGEVITYKQIFYAERQIELNRPEYFKFKIEWTVKVATVAIKEGRHLLAIQYNRERAQLINQKELEKVISPEKILEAYIEQTDFDPQTVRVVETDEFGRNLNASYYYNEMFSGLHPLATRVFALPGRPLSEGMTFEVEAEEPIVFTYKGLTPWLIGELHSFEGEVAGGKIKANFFKQSGLLESLEYSGEYLVNKKLVKEQYLYSFTGKKQYTLEELFRDESINKAVLLASLSTNLPPVPVEVLQSFLESFDKNRRRLGAAYCALRGIPEGLKLDSYLGDSDPVVSFNLAKALALQYSDFSQIKNISRDSRHPMQVRAINFLEKSTYFLPENFKADFELIQRYIYENRNYETKTNLSLEDVQQILRFMKPEHTAVGGFYKKFIRNPLTGRIQPYYVFLPLDYDPKEVYPLVVYFGGGDGRGDQALVEAYQQLMKSDELAGYILFVPEAEGMWWEETSEEAFRKMFNEVLSSYSIDTDRMYAAGTSNGAMATFFYGTRMADRFAAIFSNMGYPVVKHSPPETPKDAEMLRNLKNTSVYIVHGDSDNMVYQVGSQRAYRQLRRLRYDVKYDEFPGRDHDIKLSEIKDKIVQLFREKIRSAVPRQLDFVINEEEANWYYWIKVDKVKALPAYVAAEIDEQHNEIRIRTRNIESLTVFCDSRRLDLSKEVKIILNNKEVFSGLVEPSPEALLEIARSKLDPTLWYGASIRILSD